MEARHWLIFACTGLPLTGLALAGLALTGLALAGCADQAHLWHKEGVSDAQRESDFAACREQTRDSSEAGEAADIEASENNQSRLPGVLPETTYNRGAAMTSGNGLGDCMFGQGYRYY